MKRKWRKVLVQKKLIIIRNKSDVKQDMEEISQTIPNKNLIMDISLKKYAICHIDPWCFHVIILVHISTFKLCILESTLTIASCRQG